MRPTFDLCQTKLKIELESCRRRFRTYSGAFRIGSQKKEYYFSQISMAPSSMHCYCERAQNVLNGVINGLFHYKIGNSAILCYCGSHNLVKLASSEFRFFPTTFLISKDPFHSSEFIRINLASTASMLR